MGVFLEKQIYGTMDLRIHGTIMVNGSGLMIRLIFHKSTNSLHAYMICI